MDWSRLGKKRSKFGQWMDERGIETRELSNKSGVNRNTLGQLANRDDVSPSWRTRKRLREVAKDFDEEFSDDDFWGN